MKKQKSSTSQPSQQELLPLNKGEAHELARLNSLPDDKIGEEKLHRRAILRRRAQAHPTSFKQPAMKKHKPTRAVRQNQRQPMNTSRVATVIALLVLFGAIVGLFALFVTSPSGEAVRDSAQEAVERVQQVAAQVTEGGYECPPNIPELTFNGLGVLQPPYPTIEENPVNYCFRVEEYQKFLALTGKLEANGEEITGLEWLAKTIAYPYYPQMLDEVRQALQAINLANNTDQIGWVQIPGHGGRPQGTPVPAPSNPNWNTSSTALQPSAEGTPLPTPQATHTPVPTVVFADIPVPQAVGTPENPAVATLYPEGNTYEDNPETGETNPKLLMYQAMCKQVFEPVSISDLKLSPIWQVPGVDVLEFNHDEYGISALGPIDGNAAPQEFCYGGSCQQIYRREACIIQVTGFVFGGSIDQGNGIESQPDWAQVRLVPQFGPGDGISNSNAINPSGPGECYWHGLWHFPCQTTYPESVSTPTPITLPTPTPRAVFGSLADFVHYIYEDPTDQFDDGQWGVNRSPRYYTQACVEEGEELGQVVKLVQGPCYDSGWFVDISQVWDLIDHNSSYRYPFVVVRCDHVMNDFPTSEIAGTGVCFGPVK